MCVMCLVLFNLVYHYMIISKITYQNIKIYKVAAINQLAFNFAPNKHKLSLILKDCLIAFSKSLQIMVLRVKNIAICFTSYYKKLIFMPIKIFKVKPRANSGWGGRIITKRLDSCWVAGRRAVAVKIETGKLLEQAVSL